MKIVKSVALFLGLTVTGNLVGSAVLAQPIDLPICIGFNPERARWGMTQFQDQSVENEGFHCAPGMAYMGLDNPDSWRREPGQVVPVGSCCPLPAGALVDEHRYAMDECPDGWVVTGGRVADQSNRPGVLYDELRFELRCTKINSALFMLKPATDGIQIDVLPGIDVAVRHAIRGESSSVMTDRMRLPPELRFGIGRVTRTSWDMACVGLPWGSILTGVSVDCQTTRFRELRTLHGDPMVSRCAGIRNMYSPDASCIPLPESQR